MEKPKIPTRRQKQEKVEVKQERKQRDRKQRKEVEQVASGPFALGPAQRQKKTYNSGQSTSTAIASTTSHDAGVLMNLKHRESEDDSSSEDFTQPPIDSKLFLLQLPKTLATTTGKVGHYKKLKSGLIILEIMGQRFELQPNLSNIEQRCCFIDKEFVELGSCGQKYVCTPILDDLI